VLRIGTWGGTNRDALQEAVAKAFEGGAAARSEWRDRQPADTFARSPPPAGPATRPMDAFEIIGSLVPESPAATCWQSSTTPTCRTPRELTAAQRQPTLVAT